MATDKYDYDWSKIAFTHENPLRGRAHTFIAVSRDMSDERIKQIIRQYLPLGSIIWGIAKESYISGFEGQPQFATLSLEKLQAWVDKTNKSSKHKIFILRYNQQDLVHILKPIKAKLHVFVRGSWQHTFHTGAVYYKLVERHKKFEFISPFVSDAEAKEYAKKTKLLSFVTPKSPLTSAQAMDAVSDIAKASYDHSFQVGAMLATAAGGKYSYIAHAHNAVVPYETYAMHHGFTREDNPSPPQDLNHYDTVHAEMMLLIGLVVPKSSTLFINVMPCPTCARAIVASGISEVYYHLDHSNAYALKLFEASGIRTQRVVI
jgi:deoxycytidylate deaminase